MRGYAIPERMATIESAMTSSMMVVPLRIPEATLTIRVGRHQTEPTGIVIFRRPRTGGAMRITIEYCTV